MVEGAPFGRPAFSVACQFELPPTPLLGLPELSRSCRHRRFLHAGLSGIAGSIILHKQFCVV